MLKRFFALFTALLLALAPMLSAAAETGDEGEQPVLYDTIEIFGFTAPEWGAHPDFDLYVPEGVHYYVDFTTWFFVIEGVDVGRMQPGDVFNDESAYYYLEIEVRVEDGYDFTDDVTVLINGDDTIAEVWGWSFNAPMFRIDTRDYFVSPPECMPGDLDGNGEVTVSDAIIALRCGMGLTELTGPQLAAGDIDSNGAVDVSDAIMILRRAMGIIDGF